MITVSLKEFLRRIVDEGSSLTYDKLFSLSDPKRIARAEKQVRGPALDVYTDNTGTYSVFNFKSYPSTEHVRHHGYIKFEKPWAHKGTPAEHIPVVVDCDCKDFKYRFAWADKQRGASKVGPDSLNQALNRAPKITNPKNQVGLCKHLLAAKKYIYGLLDSTPNPTKDELEDGIDATSWKLDQLTKNAQKRTINYQGEVEKNRKREINYALANQTRNVSGPMSAADTKKVRQAQEPKKTYKGTVPLPPEDEDSEGARETKLAKLNRMAKMYTPTEPSEEETEAKNESVVNTNASMNINLKNALKLVEEIEDSIEPVQPLSDETNLTAEQTPDQEALDLLRDIRDGINKIADDKEDVEIEDNTDELAKEADEIPPVDDDELEVAGTKLPITTGAE